jgi:hypothetical protein
MTSGVWTEAAVSERIANLRRTLWRDPEFLAQPGDRS